MNDREEMKVLYLEDDQDSIELVTFTLGLDQIQVTPVSTCEEALELAMSRKFDLYLLDGLLDSGYSFELCRRLREFDPDAPVVFYTAHGFTQDIKDGVSAGADAYLVKPFAGDLAETLRSTAREKRERAATRLPVGQPRQINSAARL